MKRLKLGNKLIFLLNSFAAFLLLLSYILPYIPPKSFGFLSVLSLGVPLLILINLLFFIYWLLSVKKQLILSLVVLIIGFQYLNAMYKFTASKKVADEDNFSIMSYNVRMFNLYKWLPNENIEDDIISFIEFEKPDVLSLQEYPRSERIKLEGYEQFNGTYVKSARGGQAIYSRFPIINSGSLEFPNTSNNAIFVDILKRKDTIRVYNVHLQSARINPEVEALKKESSENLFKRVSSTFKAQQEQTEMLLEHKSKCPYKVIITGDFNNTAYSYVYNEIRGDFKDAFESAGNGFGRTYDFKFFPVRIDFILTDRAFTVNGYKTYDVKLSDHFPIKATLKL